MIECMPASNHPALDGPLSDRLPLVAEAALLAAMLSSFLGVGSWLRVRLIYGGVRTQATRRCLCVTFGVDFVVLGGPELRDCAWL